MDGNNPSDVPGGEDITPAGGENVNTPDPLAEINKATGRDYKTLPEAMGGLKETYAYVGEKKDDTPQQPNQGEDINKMTKVKLRDKVNTLEWEVKKNNFLAQNPEAKDYADEILAIAKAKGLEPQKAYDDSRFKTLIKEQSQAGDAPIVDTGNRIIPSSEELGMSLEKFNALPLEEQQKIVDKLPMYNARIGAMNMQSKPKNS